MAQGSSVAYPGHIAGSQAEPGSQGVRTPKSTLKYLATGTPDSVIKNKLKFEF